MSGFSRHLPDPPLRSSVALAVAAGVVATAAGGMLVGAPTGHGIRHAIWALGVFVPAGMIAIGTVGAHHPHPAFGPANHVTLIRLVLVALAASLVSGPPTPSVAWLVAAITTVVGLLDGCDGWLARRARSVSAFGARFDLETDALFILVLSLLVWRLDKAGAWVLLCGLMRYLFVAAGWLLPWLAGPLRSTWRGKAVAVSQLVGLGVAVLPVVPSTASAVVAGLALLALVWSFAIDVRWLFQKYRHFGPVP